MTEVLNQWVSENHLTNQAVENYSHRFVNSSCHHLVIEGFLHSKIAQQISKFLSQNANFETQYGLYKRKKPLVSRQQWEEACEQDRFFRFDRFVDAPDQGDALNLGFLKFVGLRNIVLGDEFRNYLQSITMQEYSDETDFTVHKFQSGDYLKPHDDRIKNRQLAYILYLSPNWEPSCGGELNIGTHEGSQIQLPVTFNQLTIFDVTQHKDHFVGEVNGDFPRISIGGWFSAPQNSISEFE